MTYYEELGLRPDATPEEIRQAYRHLARLLHPDAQGDQTLRSFAERQMARLNAIHATLADPIRRQQYDASLNQARALVHLAPGEAIRRRSVYRDMGFMAAGIALASLCWQLMTEPAQHAPARQTARPGPQPETAAANAAVAPRWRRPPAATAPRVVTHARQEEARVHADAPAAPVSLAEPVAEPAALAPAIEAASPPATSILPPLPAPADRPAAAAAPGFAGTWVYVRPKVLPSQMSLYPAAYIEAVIVEDGGVLRGRYRARYEVPDRPISSEVAFRFEGRAENDLASLSWKGAGGSEGELKLRLLSRNSMQLDWIATALGTQLGLASGTAVLVRRQER
jgi:hypothetical protein